MKVELSKLKEALGEAPELFICSASFEDRCRSVAEQINPDSVKNVVVLENTDFDVFISKNASLIKDRFADKARTVPLRTNDPLFVADKLIKEVLPVINSCLGLCLIDLTTLTHEQVLILIRLLFEVKPPGKVLLAYTGASDYSINTDAKEKWLSKGVSVTRSVLGFPGVMLPSRRLHLIVLVGFEHERAEKLIERYEPAMITLGLGRKEQSITTDHHQTNAEFHQRVREFAESLSQVLTDVHQFEFSCIKPAVAMADILAEASKHPDYNIAICPMNTKLSTIGAALAAFREDRIQLVYAQPVEYNIEGYSVPGDSCTIFELSHCFSEVTK